MKHLLFLLLFALPTVWLPAQKYIKSSLAFHFQAEAVQNKIGESFYYGKPGFIPSKEYAALWFRGVAKEKYPAAQYNLAVCHFFGEGTAQDKDSAVYLFRTAALQGVPEAQYNLSLCYFFGEGVKRDSAKAVSWYKKATRKKELSEMQDWKTEAEQNGGDASHLYKRVIGKDTPILDNIWVLNAIGEAFQKGTSNFPQDEKRAVYWFRLAAERMNSKAFSNLGYSLFYGSGVEQNKDSAVYYFRLAARKDITPAQCNLALCYYFGEGVIQNNDSVLYWYKKAAQHRSAIARNNLGYCYEAGIGTPQRPEQAEQHYKLAAMQGNTHAQFNLAGLYAENHQYQESLEWLQKAAEKGYIPAEKAMKALKEGNKYTYIPKGLRYGLEKSPLTPNIQIISDEEENPDTQ